MNLRVYKMTGFGVTLMTKVFDMSVRSSGLERLPDRPILFVGNHFTRIETFTLSWLIWHRYDVPIHSLAMDGLFRGRLARFLDAVGVISTRHPRRNRLITSDLMTGRMAWAIYPEGGFVKSRKVIENGRIQLDRPDRKGHPHTGAAFLAIQAEHHRRRYLEAHERGDSERLTWYEDVFGLREPRCVHRRSPVLVPVTITFPGLRTGPTWVSRLANRALGPLPAKFAEELRVEAAILARASEMSVHFGAPIEVDDYVDTKTGLGHRLFNWVRAADKNPNATNGHGRDDDDEASSPLDVRHRPGLRRRAIDLTNVAMGRVYAASEVTLDHLFCYALRVAKRDVVPVDRLHRNVALAALYLSAHPDVRVHPRLVGHAFELLDSRRAAGCQRLRHTLDLAEQEGVLRRSDDHYHILRPALTADHHFDEIRLRGLVQVFANELEPVTTAASVVCEVAALSPEQVDRRLTDAVLDADRRQYRNAHVRVVHPIVPVRYGAGAPFCLEPRSPRRAIVLTHGFLASPAQVRPLAERLRDAGHLVYCPRLAGHGTTPTAIDGITWRRWLASVRRGYEAVRGRGLEVVLGGFSFGGILSLLLAADLEERVHGVFAINAPLRLKNPLARFTAPLSLVNDACERLPLLPDRLMFRNRSECPDVTYGQTPVRAAHELRRAMAMCKHRLPKVVAPTLILQSSGDPVIQADSATQIAARLGSHRSLVEQIDSDRHAVVRGAVARVVHDRITWFVDDPTGIASIAGRRENSASVDRPTEMDFVFER